MTEDFSDCINRKKTGGVDNEYSYLEETSLG